MKKMLLLFLLGGQILFAQQVKIQSITEIKSSDPSGLFYPTFSPSGDFLLATSASYAGLKQVKISDQSINTLTSDAGAGYGVQISNDGNSIVYKKIDLQNNLRNTSLISLERSTGKKVQLVAPTREPITSKFMTNKPLYVKGKTLVRSNISSAEITPIICIENQKMVLYNGSKRTVVTPNGENASYIWPSISPDRKKILYTVASKGTFVCNIDGTNPIAIGKLNAPVWLNNQTLVGMDDIDNGERLLSSTLVTISVNGQNRQTLATPEGKMAMYPAASADGNKIAFCTEKGELYLLTIQVK